ncbi:MAG: response regulator transcription factor [Gammaproteobacteria bacterium]|nr:response regulator transcription factor [Gammaproteobacteria bacterium]
MQQSDRVISALIIDDDPGIQDMVSLAIELNWPKSTVHTAADGLTGLDLARQYNPDVVILDLGLPDVDGLEVCEKLRAESAIPIIMLTARDREIDIVKGLNAGADDYVTKPFSHLQFLARLQAVLRRSQGAAPESSYSDSHLSVDFDRRSVVVEGDTVRLTPTEFSLLEHLLRNANRVVTHEELLRAGWGEEYVDATGYIKTHIRTLREKISDDPTSETGIVNERGVGYRYVGDPE